MFLPLLLAPVSLANLPIRAIALTGQSAPGHGQFTDFRNSAGLAINNRGQVLFVAVDENARSYWRFNPDGSLTSLHHIGDPASGFPAGEKITDATDGHIFWYLNESGQTVVDSMVRDESVAWLAGPTSLLLLGRESAPPPGVPTPVHTVSALHLNDAGHVIVFYQHSFSSGSGTFFAGAPDNLQLVGTGSSSDPMLDNLGNIAFLGSRSGSYGLWFGPPSSPQLIAANDSHNRLDKPFLSKNGHIAFVNGTGSIDRPGLFIASPDSAPQLVLRAGDAAPGVPGQQIESPRLPRINDAGEVAFLAHINGRGAFWAGLPGSIKPVILPDQPAPADIDGLIFSDVWGLPMINGNGQIIARAQYLNPLTSEEGFGLWATDIDGILHLIAREHGQLHFDGQIRTISDLGIRFGLNDSGQVAFSAHFTDGSSGVFLATIPEPAAAVLLLPLLLISSPRQRRSSVISK